MEGLPAVQEAVGSMLLTLGDGNWKMGEGVQVGKGAKLGEGDESIVLEHYLCRSSRTLSIECYALTPGNL
jgi:exocyst complex protein 7